MYEMMTPVYKLMLVKESEVSYRKEKEKCCDPESVCRLLKEFGLNDQPEESFVLLTLDARVNITGLFEISKGALSSCYVDMKSIFKRVLLSTAACFMVAHNHPSGDCIPSTHDDEITNRLKKAAEVIDVKFIDHLIVVPGNNQYFSYHENGFFER